MNPTRWTPRTWFLLSIAAAAVGGAVIVLIFGEENFFVELAAGFGAALLGFAAALSWERDREIRQLRAEDERRQKDLLEETIRQEDKAKEEITRILSAVSRELEKNARGLVELSAELARSRVNSRSFLQPAPLLFDGMWTASAPRLAQILPYPELLGDLANFYGMLGELRIRARYRTEAQTRDLDEGIEELLRSTNDTLEKLGPAVERVAADPIVGPMRLTRDLDVSDASRFRERMSRV